MWLGDVQTQYGISALRYNNVRKIQRTGMCKIQS